MPPVSVTARIALKMSPRSAPAGVDREATSTDGVCREMVGEETDPVPSAALEFASAPAAAAERTSEAGGVPAAVNVQENTAVLPPGTSTGACAGDALRLAEPAVVETEGGLGAGATSRAMASPELVTPSVAVKLWPDATIGGTVSQRAESCAAAWTKTVSQVACTEIGAPVIASDPYAPPAKKTAPDEVACAGTWNVRDAPAGT